MYILYSLLIFISILILEDKAWIQFNFQLIKENKQLQITVMLKIKLWSYGINKK